MTRCIRLLTVLGLLAVPALALAQESQRPPVLTSTYELVLTDGSRIYGEIVAETAGEIHFRTTAGAVITAPRDRIAALKPVVGRVVRGEFRREDPNNTRLLFAPTGRSLRRGEVYLGVYEVSMPFVQVGLTDRISFGGGTPLVFGFDESQRPFWITPKVQVFSRERLHVSAGVFHGFSVSGDGLGIAYGVVTRDGDTGSVSLGAGMGYTSEGNRGGVFMVGADAPLRRNMKLITENYVWNSGGVGSLGVRFFGDNLSADVAVGIVFTDDGVFGAPVVNFVYHF